MNEPAGPYSIDSDRLPGLSKLIEEMGEVQQIAGKLIATGGKAEHWDGTDLMKRMSEELADLSAAVQFFSDMNGMYRMGYNERRFSKYCQFMDWYNEQRRKA